MGAQAGTPWRPGGVESDLISAAQGGDEGATAALCGKYRNLVRCKARSYFLVGAERDDVLQEGMIGLCKAIRDYRPDRQASFRSFAELCVRRQLITAIKTASRQKHSPRNSYVSLQRPAIMDEDGDRTLSDILATKAVSDPAQLVISAWEANSIKQGFTGALSPFETEVLGLYVSGCSYAQIGERLGRHAKAVDNALQRVKRKVELQVQRCRAC